MILCPAFNAAMQRKFVYFDKIVRSDIYGHNRINLMTGFFMQALERHFARWGQSVQSECI